MMWVTGADSMEGVMKFLAVTLKGVADQITCPLLVVMAAQDRQIPSSTRNRPTTRRSIAK